MIHICRHMLINQHFGPMTLLDPPQLTMQNVIKHTKLYSFMDHGYVSIGNECQAYLFQGGEKP